MSNPKMFRSIAQGPGPCHLCGGFRLELEGEHWVVDHIIPRAHGGKDVPQNLAKAHSTCNKWRGAQALSQEVRLKVAKRRRIELFIES